MTIEKIPEFSDKEINLILDGQRDTAEFVYMMRTGNFSLKNRPPNFKEAQQQYQNKQRTPPS